MAFNRFCRAALDERDDRRLRRRRPDPRLHLRRRRRHRAAPCRRGLPESRVGVFNLGGGSRASVNEALSLIGELAERELRVSYGEAPNGDVRDTCADTTRTREALGFVPRTRLSEGLAAEFEWTQESLRAAHALSRAPGL